MKLIIDMPVERLNSIKQFGIKQNEVSMLERALVNGTPFDSVIEDIRAKILNMPQDFDINETDEWNSKSLYTVISRCSEWAMSIIDKHVGKESK